MKNRIVAIMAVLPILFTGFPVPVHALADPQSAAIQKLLDDACRISGVPGMSTSISTEMELFTFLPVTETDG